MHSHRVSAPVGGVQPSFLPIQPELVMRGRRKGNKKIHTAIRENITAVIDRQTVINHHMKVYMARNKPFESHPRIVMQSYTP